MKANFMCLRVGSNLILFLILAGPAWGAEPLVYFGLSHTPLAGAVMDTRGGELRVTPANDGDGPGDPGDFGVSVELGEADSGIFGYLDTYNSLNWDGNSMIGRVYGRLNGQSDQFLCSLGVVGVQSTDYVVTADFSPLGASGVTYLVFNGPTLVGSETNTTGPVHIETWSESSPSANPFWKLPDGRVAAVVQLSTTRTIRLPGWVDPDDASEEGPVSVAGDRIVIIAENISGVADFASRVDLTAGGGEDLIVITDERLGMFNRGHKALGDATLVATGGALTIGRLDPEQPGRAIGVAIELEECRQFSLKVQPQDLTTNGAALVASAVGGDRGAGEFLGYAGARNQNGSVQVFGDLSSFAEGLQLSVFRNHCLAGTALAPALSAVVHLSGNPRVAGFEAGVDAGPVHAALAVRLDRLTTFLLPDGSTLEGDEIRFGAANRSGLDRLGAFNLTSSNLASFTIVAETGPQTISLADYFPEVVAPAFVKAFAGADDGAPVQFLRSPIQTNVDGRRLVILADTSSETNQVSTTHSFQEDGLRFHGLAHDSLTLFGAAGLRLLPRQVTVGQTYFSQGSFVWHDPASGGDVAVEVASEVTVAGWENVTVPAGAFPALRVETVTIFAAPGASSVPTNRCSTNWLAAGVGVIRFRETEDLADGSVRARSGELVDYAILPTPARTQTVNVGANIILSLDLYRPWSGSIEWLKDGVPLPNVAPGTQRLFLNDIKESDAGTYSVRVALRDVPGQMVGEVAKLRVVPFGDTPPFWALACGSGSVLEVRASATDQAGNTYLAGRCRGSLVVGSETLPSLGSDDIFLVKIGPTGQALWTRRAGGASSDTAHALGVDAAGHVYLTGVAGPLAAFGPLRLSNRSMFFTKVDPNGNFLWLTNSVMTGSTYNTLPFSMAVDSLGSQYVLGTLGEGSLSLGSITLTNRAWTMDLFLTKLDPAGQFLWAQQVSGYGPAWDPVGGPPVYANSLALDAAGALYLAGCFYDQAAFGSAILRSDPPGQPAGFLAKTDLDGNFLWAKALGIEVVQAALDSNRNVCLSGQFSGSVNLGGLFLSSRYLGGTDAFLAKFDPNGSCLWARPSPHPPGSSIAPLAVDTADNIYLAGGFYHETTHSGVTYSMPSSSSTMLTKLEPGGQTLWHKQITGSGDNWPSALASGPAGQVFLAGNFRSQVVFGETRLWAVSTENAYLVEITGATSPTITQQPQAQAVNLGEPATFSVTATGTDPLTYQWRKDGLDVEGATGPSYTLAQAQWHDSGSYSVVVRNAGGLARSTEALLQVRAPEASLLAFAEATQTLVESTTMALVTVSRTGNLSNAVTVDLMTADVTALAGQDYWETMCSLSFPPGVTRRTVAIPIVDNSEFELTETFMLQLCHPGPGVVVGQPDTATITITDPDPLGLPIIRRQPVHSSVGIGGTVTFQVVAESVAPLTYQWRKDGAELDGATNRTLTLQDVQPSGAGAYSVVVRNAAGEVVSASAILTVVPPPVFVVEPQSQTIPYAEEVFFRVMASSSVPDSTQIWSRAASGPNSDVFTILAGGHGTLSVQYHFKASLDTIVVYEADPDEDWTFLGAITTNGTGRLTVNFGHVPGNQIIIVVTPWDEDGGDGWSYQVEKATSPLTYQWFKNIEGTWSSVGSGPTYTINYVRFLDGGTYSVTASDPFASVTGQPFTLTVIGPQLRLNQAACSNGEPGCSQLWWRAYEYRLERSQDLSNGQWQEVSNAYTGMNLPLSDGQRFFRLARPTPPD